MFKTIVYIIFLKDQNSKSGLKVELPELGSICKHDIASEWLIVRRLRNTCTFLPCGKSRRVGLQRRLGWRLLLRRRKRISPRQPPRKAGGKGWGFRSSRGCTCNRCSKSGPVANATQYVACLWRTFPRLLYQNCSSYLESQLHHKHLSWCSGSCIGLEIPLNFIRKSSFYSSRVWPFSVINFFLRNDLLPPFLQSCDRQLQQCTQF